ncbi:M20/M25/M40 family metallo-hydrolase [Owenweeksia hongkongensis]|uniref:M20/M25/M40 family metallo-hydrolase n=1 Tax=Owenweeksia hongkongensis TaxID=253245 RepID=UPI003A9333A4
MKKSFALAFLLGAAIAVGQSKDNALSDEEILKGLYTTALVKNQGYKWLEELTEMGPRLTGSENATKTVYHFQKIADSLGFKTFLQPVTVPQWVRGEAEEANYKTTEGKIVLNPCALGGSIATPKKGLTAPLFEITSFEQLDTLTTELEGKIAFYNIPMNPAFINTFFAYSSSAKQRYVGALEASKKGALGVVIRSLSATINDFPHTGSMTYKGADVKIPAMAISTLDAEQLSTNLNTDPSLEFFMKMSCESKDSVISYNLVAEIKGSEKPEEVIVLGGHIDSWDLGTGAHDDGAGCVHSLEAIWLLKQMDLLPKRTVRVVFFMNEEFGLNGAKVYAKESKEDNVNHVIAIESDAGGFSPRGISVVAPDSLVARVREFRSLFEPYGLHQFTETGSGADISQLYSKDLVMLGLRPDNHRYFDIHHSAADVIESVSPRELEMGSATLAAFIYLLDKYDVIAK